MTKRKFMAMTLATVMTLSLAACGGGAKTTGGAGETQAVDTTAAVAESGAADTGSSAAKDTITIAMDTDSEPAAGFDPILGWATAEHTHNPMIQSTLLKTNDDLSIGYDLAESYEISDDGLTWTFKMRTDVKFTNGEALTAADVAFTYNEVKNQEIEADFTMLDSAEAVGDDTVIFHLNKPYNIFAYTVAVMGIVPDESYDPATYGDNPIGSGPFMLKQWNKGEQVTLVENPDYYGEESKIKTINIVFMSEEAAYAAAAAGSVDVAYTAPNYTQQPIDGYYIHSFFSEDIRGIAMPCVPEGSTYTSASGETQPAGDDVTCIKSVRQALSIAIDRDFMVENVEYGYGSAAYSDCSGLPWESADMKCNYDPEAAKKILEDDGWVMGDDGVYVRDGLKCSFELWYDATNAVRTGLAMAVSEYAKAIGMEIVPCGFNGWSTFGDKTHDVAWICGAGTQSPYALPHNYYTGMNSPMYSNEVSDAYMDEALATKNLEDSYELWQKAQWDGETGVAPQGDAPWIWLVNCDHIYFAKDGLKIVDEKIQPHGTGWTIIGNIANWYWE